MKGYNDEYIYIYNMYICICIYIGTKDSGLNAGARHHVPSALASLLRRSKSIITNVLPEKTQFDLNVAVKSTLVAAEFRATQQ